MIDTSSAGILKKRSVIIAPDSTRKVQVNNVTGPKAAFPPNAPWIVLASDNEGNVYEADLRPLFGKAK
jgi:cell wall assembly regulator SMI1